MRVLDLFSGVGGFSLGLERAGMETVAFCEYDKKARLVLNKHWPDIPIYNDIRKLGGSQIADEIGAVDLICGGFPCQPFSVAGKQRGDQDDRHLWPEMFRLIQEIRPNWVIGENVTGIIHMGLDEVLSDLEGEGYSCQTFIIPACAVNASHRRDRVWIVADSKRRKSWESTEQKGRQGFGGGSEESGNVANTQIIGVEGGGTAGIEVSRANAGKEIPCGDCSRDTGSNWATGQLNPTWVEWLMGFPVGWTDLSSSGTQSSRKSSK